MKIFKSEEDVSVNFVFGEKINEYFEARYVRREDDYIVCYISVKKGCSKGCKFCHLTTTNQTNEADASVEEILEQVKAVKTYYDEAIKNGEKKARVVHFNFMARGEPLDSNTILNQNQELFMKMSEIFDGLIPKFNISTIMPNKLGNKKLSEIFKGITPTIYYSLYSTNEDFRTIWMPQAMEINKAFQLLKDYQQDTKKIIKIHQTLIKDKNDSFENTIEIANKITEYKLLIEYQIVRYNAFSEEEGEESSEEHILTWIKQLQTLLPHFNIKMLNRVGYDVNASCGMFYH